MSSKLGATGTEIASLARTAFVNSMSSSLWVGVGLAVTAAVIAVTHLPRYQTELQAEAVAANVADNETRICVRSD